MKTRTFGISLIGIGGAGLLALLALSVADASLRAWGTPFIGAKEISEFCLSVCVAIALPISVYFGKAVSVDSFVRVLPDGLGRALTACGEVFAAGLCAVMAYQLVQAGNDAADFAEETALLKIPHIYMYQVLAFGFALTVPAFVMRAWISTKVRVQS